VIRSRPDSSLRGFRRLPAKVRRAIIAVGGLTLLEIGTWIVAPSINGGALADYFRRTGSTPLLKLYDWLVGGALSRGAVLALGVMPYVTARIVLRLGRTVAPAAYEPGGMLSDPAGITRWTRRITFGCALVQSVGFARFVQSIPGVVTNPGLGFIAQTVVVLTTGAMGVAWLAERMTSQRDSDDVDIEDVSGESPLGARAQV
jgi:preprotein translocase subunit SecY